MAGYAYRTGENTKTGGRIKRIGSYLNGEDFCCTYGDGVVEIDIKKLVAFHKSEKQLATLTATIPPGRFGAIAMADFLSALASNKPISKLT